MSAAATAAGYLYASGRLRGRNSREGGQEPPARDPLVRGSKRREIRVAAIPQPGEPAPQAKPRRTPKIEYRTRRWKPE